MKFNILTEIIDYYQENVYVDNQEKYILIFSKAPFNNM